MTPPLSRLAAFVSSHAPARFGDRILGTYDAARPGPTFVIFGGIHGNEPAGVEAARVVLDELRRLELPLRGRLVGVAGNLAALGGDRRFVDRDLNRRWFESDLGRLLAADPALDGAEDRQQRELAAFFEEIDRSTDGPAVFLDLHSTSGVSAPFMCMADTLRNRRVALALPLPIILGLEEAIDGTVMGYLTERGHTAFAIEGGKHDAPATLQNHVSAIWLALVASGNLAAGEVPRYTEHRARLEGSAEGQPRLLEITYRHPVAPEDGFVMDPGFWSFQPVKAGTRLAHDKNGPIRTPRDAVMLMPLYQAQGEDGFFLGRPLSLTKLRVSSLLRTLRLEFLLDLIPGVRPHFGEADRWLVPASVSEGFTRDLFFLFGYRRMRREGVWVVFGRRRPGFLGRTAARPGEVDDEDGP
ncbi:MAG: succinylglutamate desuccinylase/aspartoacylase family protein [Planctomycetes bacterium]|nr:succinylglutamate desuccinylase/aspartoacylase family protein [Planctomycetota bacterium]